jgi:hypothetical protein
MRDPAAATVAAFVAALTKELEPRGWRQRKANAVMLGTWTTSLADGFTAIAEVVFVHVLPRTRLPVRVQFLHGVGYEPATELLPALGLPVMYTVLADPSSYTADAAMSLSDQTDLDALAHEVAELASGPWAQFAREHADTELIDAGLAAKPTRPHALTWRVVLLAAAGERERAHQLAHDAGAQAQPSGRKDAIDLAAQLDRWLATQADGE